MFSNIDLHLKNLRSTLHLYLRSTLHLNALRFALNSTPQQLNYSAQHLVNTWIDSNYQLCLNILNSKHIIYNNNGVEDEEERSYFLYKRFLDEEEQYH